MPGSSVVLGSPVLLSTPGLGDTVLIKGRSRSWRVATPTVADEDSKPDADASLESPASCLARESELVRRDVSEGCSTALEGSDSEEEDDDDGAHPHGFDAMRTAPSDSAWERLLSGTPKSRSLPALPGGASAPTRWSSFHSELSTAATGAQPRSSGSSSLQSSPGSGRLSPLTHG